MDRDPQDLLDDVLDAKELSGESLDPSSPRVRQSVLKEIAAAQAAIRRVASPGPAGRIAVHRAMVLGGEALAALAPGCGLGESWAFDRRGAHPYDATRRGQVVVLSGTVDPDDVAWEFVLAMWSSGEGEARLKASAEIEIVAVSTARGEPLRPDLVGSKMGVCQLPAAPPGPRR